MTPNMTEHHSLPDLSSLVPLGLDFSSSETPPVPFGDAASGTRALAENVAFGLLAMTSDGRVAELEISGARIEALVRPATDGERALGHAVERARVGNRWAAFTDDELSYLADLDEFGGFPLGGSDHAVRDELHAEIDRRSAS
jgi:hypothetical protein